MKPKYGSSRSTTITDDNDSTRTPVEVFRDGDVVKSYIHQTKRIKVNSVKEEMSEYIRFSDQLQRLKEAGLLFTWVKDVKTIPSFTIDYGNHDDSKEYFVELSWAEKSA